MTDSVDILLNAEDAFNAEQYELAIELLTKIINEYSNQVLNDKKKESLIKLIKIRIDAFFSAERYHDVLMDIEKLKKLNVKVEDDPNLSFIVLQSRFSFYTCKCDCVEELKIEENKCK